MRALVLLLVAPAVLAQTWGASAVTATERLGERGTWAEQRAAVGLQTDRFGGVVEAGRVERFDRDAAFVGADLYPSLGEGVYANARVRVAPGSDVTARLDLGAEVFVALGGGWEGSLGGRRLAYADRAVHVASASAARYVGPWYVRGTASAVPDAGRVPLSGRLLVRYLTDGGGAFGEFWEVSAGRGEEAEVSAAGASSIRDSWHAGARLQQRVAGPVLATGGLGYVADGDLSRAQAQAGVLVRW